MEFHTLHTTSSDLAKYALLIQVMYLKPHSNYIFKADILMAGLVLEVQIRCQAKSVQEDGQSKGKEEGI